MGNDTQSGAKGRRAAPAARHGAAFTLDIVDDAGQWASLPDLDTEIRKAAAALSRHPRIQPAMPAAACVALSDDAAVKKLNAAYRAKDKPTNVLSFPALPQPPSRGADTPFIGDIVLAEETVRREARELTIPVTHHIQHLVVHGLLHLLGYDHETDGDASIMETIETETLASLGIADPYSLNETSEPAS